MKLFATASPKFLVGLGIASALFSVFSFFTGLILFGIGVTRPSAVEVVDGGGGGEEEDGGELVDGGATPQPQPQPAPDGQGGGGFLAGLREAASKVIPGGGGGPEGPGYNDGHPVGLYLMTRFWIATGSLEKAVWYFTNDGRVYLNPQDGFDEAKLASSERHGTVTVAGDKMTVKWNDGDTDTSNIEREEGGFNWNAGIFAPVKGFNDPSELVGTWEGGSSISFSGNSAVTSNTFVLNADGTFTRSGAASMRTESDESVVSAGATGGSNGTWRLDGYALTMTHNDGRVVRGVTFPFDDEETPIKPDRFYFAGTMYKKQS